MTAQEIRRKYLEFMEARGHKLVPRALLVPQNDPTTLFTGSGMQPMIPYLLGEPHPDGKRLADSQVCFRAQDIEEIGDAKHTTFFEMLGNWSLGDYFKKDQIEFFSTFLFDELKLDPARIYVSCYAGNKKFGIPADHETTKLWQEAFKKRGIEAKVVDIGPAENGARVGMQGGRIFLYDGKENWWSRGGDEEGTPVGDPCGPDSEVFYDFGEELHSEKEWGKPHPASDSPRFLEIGNSVFMTYKKTKDGFEELPEPNVDFGGGLERLAAAVSGNYDVFHIDLMWPVIEKLEELSNKKYDSHTESMRVIADHLRGAVWLAVDGVTPSNKQQGYVLRRLLRRAIRYAFELGIEQDLCEKIAPTVINLYKNNYPEVAKREKDVLEAFSKEEKIFRQTLRKGLQVFEKEVYLYSTNGYSELSDADKLFPNKFEKIIHGELLFKLYDTYGFPVELSKEEAFKQGIKVADNADAQFEKLMREQRQRSQTASAGMFKGGLADHSEAVVKLHTTTHLMYQALKNVLGNSVVQRGSNITAERSRFDFSHPEKVTREQLDEVERIVNEKIAEDLPVTWKEEKTDEAFKKGASGAFGDKYGDVVKVYTIGDPEHPFSREICGGPHVEHTGVLGEGGKKFKILKEEASSAGVRRIKAVLQ
ncbi:MAG TPA: alanine--tRNA ligase [Candidatus Saccharimonadales bacterium]|nr:alanine--tRNA ligase [Candidatus Saccharimonadales bacterium]